MFTKVMKTVRIAAPAVAAVGIFTVFGPAGNSFAINEVQCNPDEDFSKIWSHNDFGSQVNCYANGGKTPFSGWVDKVEAGKNRLFLYDRNGDVIAVEKWQTLVRNTPADIVAVEIR
ncbi:beta/gamma crystallin domain-containing protein [Nocardia carnea]|uniref:beta/gamma crystallin domain-containing protein n=1 Tax=Nocardia carnea TaxID=37328 RepID=UPI002454A2D0|nr:beta/gamma crystallin domain-containing protein [Nocardia carnea]